MPVGECRGEKVHDDGLQAASQLRNRSRSLVFQNLPVEVRGIASRNSKCSGSCHLANLCARCSRSSSARRRLARTEHHARERAFRPLRVRDRDHRGFRNGRVAHQRVLEVDRADPLAAGLDQVLGAVGDARRNRPRRSCATSPVRNQPSSVNCPARVGRCGSGGDQGAAHLELADRAGHPTAARARRRRRCADRRAARARPAVARSRCVVLSVAVAQLAA